MHPFKKYTLFLKEEYTLAELGKPWKEKRYGDYM